VSVPRRLVRAGLLAVALGFGLGCMGLVDDFTSLDMVFETGEDARHPADFVVGPPSGGKRTAFVAITATADNLNLPKGVVLRVPPDQPMRMETVTYEGVAMVQREAASDALEAAGFTRRKSDPQVSVWSDADQQMYVLFDDPPTWMVVRLTPVEALRSD
jgi:hypothetical protein